MTDESSKGMKVQIQKKLIKNFIKDKKNDMPVATVNLVPQMSHSKSKFSPKPLKTIDQIPLGMSRTEQNLFKT